jgi:Ca2+-binding RTX toxin-like protein
MTTGITAFFNDFMGITGGVNLKLLALQDLSQIITELLENPPPTDAGDIPNIDIIDGIPVGNTEAGSSVGNVNLNTFDGLEYSLQIGGEFTLIDPIDDSFTVQVRAEHPEGSPIAFYTAIATSLGGQRIGIYADEDIPLRIDGNPVDLATGATLSLANGSIVREGDNYTIIDNNDHEIKVTLRNNTYRYLDLQSVLADNLNNSVIGLLGNSNGEPGDDLSLPDGTVLTAPVDFQQLYTDFVEGQKITGETSLFDYAEGESTETFSETNFFDNNNYLVGLTVAEIILAGDGNDVIAGSAGADTLNGGQGIDRLIYRTSETGVTVNLGTNSVDGGEAAEDAIANFEYVDGSRLDDNITGNGGDNQLRGQNGNDIVFGLAGNDNIFGGRGVDSLDGGEGIDQVIYGDSDAAVTINLATNTVDGGYATGDIVSNFEYAGGSIFDDNLTGNDLVNHLRGQLGNDLLLGAGGNDNIFGGGGADTLDGGEGIDQLFYEDSDAGVSISLTTNTADGGHAIGDIISNFEYITGSKLDDLLKGNEAINHLRGQLGNDLLLGEDGDDNFFGEEGADTISGGNGIDTFTFNSLEDSLLSNLDLINDLEIARDKINSVNSVGKSEIAKLGAVTTLDETAIQTVLTADSFIPNQAATFSFENRTFVALNDDTAGYGATTDALIEITGFTGSLADLAII